MASKTTASEKRTAIALAVVIIAGGVASGLTIGAHYSATPGVSACAIPPTGDVTAALDACFASLPPNTTWNGGGKVYAVSGVEWQCPATDTTEHEGDTINDATFNDQTTGPNVPSTHLAPVFDVLYCGGVSFSGVHFVGAHTTQGNAGRYLASATGLRLRSTSGTTVTQSSSVNTFGDGMELVAYKPGKRSGPAVTGLSVNGFTSTMAGRDGVVIGNVSESTLAYVTVTNSGATAINAETDSPNSGSAGVTLIDPVADVINFIEYLYGPVTIINPTANSMRLVDAQGQTISVNSGSLSCARRSPVPCLGVVGGNVNVNQLAFNRQPGTSSPTTPAWSATAGAHLTLTHCAVTPPPGTHDATSTVTVVP